MLGTVSVQLQSLHPRAAFQALGSLIIPGVNLVSMASKTFLRLVQVANCVPVRRSVVVNETDARKAMNSVRRQYDKPRTMVSASQESSPVYTGNEVGKRREDFLLRGRTHSPLDIFHAFDAFFPNRSLLSMINTMDRVFDDSLLSRRRTGLPSPFLGNSRPPWDFKETEESFRMRIDLPGLSKEEVKVYVEDRSLVIKGEHKDEGEKKNDNEDQRSSRSYVSYSTRIQLPDNANTEQITAEMKNGELLVTVPKIISESKKNVMDIPVM